MVQLLRAPSTVGQLNYLLTSLCLAYIRERNNTEEFGPVLTYGAINDVIGALECCKQEIYRRVGVPLENRAMGRNGDLPEFARPVRGL